LDFEKASRNHQAKYGLSVKDEGEWMENDAAARWLRRNENRALLRGLLAAEGCKIGRRHVKTLMKRMGIEALYRRPRTTKPEPGHKIYPYLLRGMEIVRPNQVWAMDITYIPMERGFVYLAVVLDWFSRRVLSWGVSITMEAAFCVETL
jgi:putative transposase